MTDLKKNMPAELNDDQMEQVSGGTQPDPNAIPMDEGLVDVQLMGAAPRVANMK